MTRKFAIEHLWDNRFAYHPAELVHLGCQFNVSKLFLCGFKYLLAIPMKDIRKEHRYLLGSDVFVALVYGKALLDDHTRFVACEEPEMLTHADDCQDSVGCREDWHAIWWNGMGRFLLDARNPQPFEDAVDRFRELKFGRMSPGCKQMMFDVLKHGVAFRHADVFITGICNGLVAQLRLDA